MVCFERVGVDSYFKFSSVRHCSLCHKMQPEQEFQKCRKNHVFRSKQNLSSMGTCSTTTGFVRDVKKNPTRGEHNLSLKGFPEECYIACLALLSFLDTPRIVCPSDNPLDFQNIVSTEGNYLLTIIRYETPFLIWNMRRFDYLLTKPSELDFLS